MGTIEYTGEKGCLVDGHWGQYAAARVILIADSYGWDEPQIIRIARKHLDSMGPSRNPSPTEAEFEILNDGEEKAENWLNENVAEEGYSFGYQDGEYFYMSDEWWGEE